MAGFGVEVGAGDLELALDVAVGVGGLVGENLGAAGCAHCWAGDAGLRGGYVAVGGNEIWKEGKE